MKKNNEEYVVHPNHYQNGKFETKDLQKIILNYLRPDPYTSLCLGDVIKYIDRYGKKWETKQELDKSKEYLEFCNYKIQKEKIENYIDIKLSQGYLTVVEWFQLKRILDCFYCIYSGEYSRSLEYWKEIREESENELGIFSNQL